MNSIKSSFHTQFYLNYKPISILKCIIEKSNGNPFESQYSPHINEYCSLQMIDSEKLKILKYNFSPKNAKPIKTPIDFLKINISKLTQSSLHNYAQVSWVIDNLTSFHCYNVSISSTSEYRSIQSNHKLLLIPEVKPSKPPENIQIYWMLPDIAVNIKWDLPDRKYWNGILTGSKIYMKSNESEIVHNFNDSLSNKIIAQVNPHLNWLFRISLVNCAGESERSPAILLYKLSDALLSKSDNVILSQSQKINFFKKSWMIATLVVTSVLIWLMMSFLTMYLCCSRTFTFNGHRFSIGKTGRTDETASSKDFKDELFINPMHNMEKENDLHFNESEKNFNFNNVSLSPVSSNSFCNPYASTQIFESMPENRVCDMGTDFIRPNWMEPENMNLYYLSTPIFDSPLMNDVCQNQLNYFLSNTHEWMVHSNMANPVNKNPLLPFSMYPSQDDCTTSSSDLHVGKDRFLKFYFIWYIYG